MSLQIFFPHTVFANSRSGNGALHCELNTIWFHSICTHQLVLFFANLSGNVGQMTVCVLIMMLICCSKHEPYYFSTKFLHHMHRAVCCVQREKKKDNIWFVPTNHQTLRDWFIRSHTATGLICYRVEIYRPNSNCSCSNHSTLRPGFGLNVCRCVKHKLMKFQSKRF